MMAVAMIGLVIEAIGKMLAAVTVVRPLTTCCQRSSWRSATAMTALAWSPEATIASASAAT